jgi:hypothetical protein
MMDGRDPWDILAIEPTADERAIKRAYASRLKAIDLERDPEGFQALVEARELALIFRGPMPNFDGPGGDGEDEEPPHSEPDSGQSVAAGNFLESETSPSADPPESDTEVPESEVGAIAAAIAAFLNGESADAFAAESAVQRLSELSFDDRAGIEYRLIEAMAVYLSGGGVAHRKLDDSHRRSRQHALVIALDEEFGWSRNDRKLHEVLGEDAYEAIDMLHRLLNPSYRPVQSGGMNQKSGWMLNLVWRAVICILLFLIIRSCNQYNEDSILKRLQHSLPAETLRTQDIR